MAICARRGGDQCMCCLADNSRAVGGVRCGRADGAPSVYPSRKPVAAGYRALPERNCNPGVATELSFHIEPHTDVLKPSTSRWLEWRWRACGFAFQLKQRAAPSFEVELKPRCGARYPSAIPYA